MSTEKLKWKNHKGESTEAVHRGGTTRSSDEVSERGWSVRRQLFLRIDDNYFSLSTTITFWFLSGAERCRVFFV